MKKKISENDSSNPKNKGYENIFSNLSFLTDSIIKIREKKLKI